MKETSLSQTLLKQMTERSDVLKLDEKSSILPFLPPFLLKEMPQGTFQGISYHFETFQDFKALLKAHPGAPVKKGFPHEIAIFLQKKEEVFLDFESVGLVRLTREDTGREYTVSRMSQWLNYALSPELWGPEGKWTRFHAELNKFLVEKKLLLSPSHPGLYRLNPDMCRGVGGNFTLVLPWTFSLSDLKRLMKLFEE